MFPISGLLRLAILAMLMTLGFSDGVFTQDFDTVERLSLVCGIDETDACEREVEALGAEQAALAVEALRRACEERGNDAACNALGYFHEVGLVVAEDYAKARVAYEQACFQSNMAGCFNLGYMYVEALGVARDYVKGAELIQRACGGGELLACIYLGQMYEEGRRLPKDIQRAQNLFRKACLKGGEASFGCVMLSISMMHFPIQAEDRDVGFARLKESCDVGNIEGCFHLWALRGFGQAETVDIEAIQTTLLNACDNGITDGCLYLASVVLSEGGHNRFAQMLVLYQKACAGGAQKGCESAQFTEHLIEHLQP